MLIRYPGSKAKLASSILAECPDELKCELWALSTPVSYYEPFFGSGAMGFRFLSVLHHSAAIHLNDIDPGLYCLWTSVLNEREELQSMIRRFIPSTKAFYTYKERDGDRSDGDLKCGFRKLALHQMSVSGFGYKSGGPLGGKTQGKSEYTVDCRWNAQTLIQNVRRCHQLFKRFPSLKITCGDFEDAVSTADESSFTYFDPPYVEKGKQLYRYDMSDEQHNRLANLCRRLPGRWVVSYDDHPLVRGLYSDRRFVEIEVTYSNAVSKTAKRPKNREILICSI